MICDRHDVDCAVIGWQNASPRGNWTMSIFSQSPVLVGLEYESLCGKLVWKDDIMGVCEGWNEKIRTIRIRRLIFIHILL